MNGKKKSNSRNGVAKPAATKQSTIKNAAQTPVWQQKKGGKRGSGRYQSQPRSVGKRYWRM